MKVKMAKTPTESRQKESEILIMDINASPR